MLVGACVQYAYGVVKTGFARVFGNSMVQGGALGCQFWNDELFLEILS